MSCHWQSDGHRWNWEGVGALCKRGARVWRSVLQTLLEFVGCGGVVDLLPGRLQMTQGRLAEARLTLGCNPQPLQGWGVLLRIEHSTL